MQKSDFCKIFWVELTQPEQSLNHQTPFIAITAHEEIIKHQEAIRTRFSMVRMKPLSMDKAEAFLKAYTAISNILKITIEV